MNELKEAILNLKTAVILAGDVSGGAVATSVGVSKIIDALDAIVDGNIDTAAKDTNAAAAGIVALIYECLANKLGQEVENYDHLINEDPIAALHTCKAGICKVVDGTAFDYLKRRINGSTKI